MTKEKLPEGPIQEKLYFPSLDGLRFFAFLAVFLHHVFINTSSSNPFLNSILVIFQKNGWVGVDLFFVLSGFLITLLLLEERKIYKKISLKNFWIRRSLRIWPLYFLALIIGFLLIPFLLNQFKDEQLLNELKNQFWFYFLFLGNWEAVNSGYSNFRYITHLWTISLEEQFYIFWPLLLIHFKTFRKLLFFCLVLISSSILIRLVLSLSNIEHPGIYINTFARMDTLTIGALLAIFYSYKKSIINFLHIFCTLPIQIIALTTLGFFLYKFYFFNPYLNTNVVFGYSIIAIFMFYFTLSALKNSAYTSFLKFKPFVYLGKISYGLYIWHILAIDLAFLNFNNYFFRPILAFIITLFLGTISYYFFEMYFLKFKIRFSKISSRPV